MSFLLCYIKYSFQAPENSINQHELEDVNGATLSSLTVFSECLKFLKDDVLTSLTRTINDQVGTRDIYWIILIPAVWSKYGQQLIRLAANQVMLTSLWSNMKKNRNIEINSGFLNTKYLSKLIQLLTKKKLSKQWVT